MTGGCDSLSGGRSRRARGRGVRGQQDPEGGPGADLALHRDAAAMTIDDAVNDRQAEARTLADVLGREERIEDLRDHVGRDPGAVVGDGDLDLLALAVRGDADGAAAVAHAERLRGVR